MPIPHWNVISKSQLCCQNVDSGYHVIMCVTMYAYGFTYVQSVFLLDLCYKFVHERPRRPWRVDGGH